MYLVVGRENNIINILELEGQYRILMTLPGFIAEYTDFGLAVGDQKSFRYYMYVCDNDENTDVKAKVQVESEIKNEYNNSVTIKSISYSRSNSMIAVGYSNGKMKLLC